jgi:hypothetical protein
MSETEGKAGASGREGEGASGEMKHWCQHIKNEWETGRGMTERVVDLGNW